MKAIIDFLDGLVYSPLRVIHTFFLLIVLIVIQLCLIISLFRIVRRQNERIENLKQSPQLYTPCNSIDHENLYRDDDFIKFGTKYGTR